MGWLYLLLAGALEVGWAIGLKYAAKGFHPLAWGVTGLMMATSLALLALALRSLPLGTAYAAWTGIGTIGTVAAGIILLAEPVSAFRLACVGLVLAGILGLKAA